MKMTIDSIIRKLRHPEQNDESREKHTPIRNERNHADTQNATYRQEHYHRPIAEICFEG